MGVGERVRQLLAGRPFVVDDVDAGTAEVTYDPAGHPDARHRLHEATGTLASAGLDVEQVDMHQWTEGLPPGVADGTRTPNRARRIVPSGPPRLVVRER